MGDNSNKFLHFRAKFFLVLILGVSGSVMADSKLPDTLAKIKPSIVAIGTYAPKRNPRATFLGTGFVVTEGHWVVTSAHVIPESLDGAQLEQVAIFYRHGEDEKMQFASLVSMDFAHDLALLKIADPLPAMDMGNAASVREGQVYAFTGYPIGMVLGLYPVTHRGMISAISPNVIPAIKSGQISPKLRKRLDVPYNVFQLDATAYPGSSGSPLYDVDKGTVVGVINKVFVQESKENALSNPSGISYAIPGSYIVELLKVKTPH